MFSQKINVIQVAGAVERERALNGLHGGEIAGVAHLGQLLLGGVQAVDVALVMNVVVEPHRLLVDVRLECVVVVREVRKNVRHGISPSSFGIWFGARIRATIGGAAGWVKERTGRPRGSSRGTGRLLPSDPGP